MKSYIPIIGIATVALIDESGCTTQQLYATGQSW